jgi:predicted transposase/invertase (TIGR01784 family)
MSDDLRQLHTPHDKFFKETFGRLDTARDFFQIHLPPRLAAAMEWETLKLEPGSFIDERLSACCY